MTKAPLFWLKKVESAVNAMKEIPLWGSPPPFPWDICREQIASLLQMPDLQIEHRQTHFLSAEELRSGLGEAPSDIAIALPPLPGALHWLMAQEDIAKLTQSVLSAQTEVQGFSSAKFQEGFYRYLTLNILQALDELQILQDLSLKIAPNEFLPSEGALCVDVAVKHQKFLIWGRLVCPPSFLQAFKTHFNAQHPSLLFEPLVKQMDVDLRLTVGNAILSIQEYKSIKVGDFIVLDRCTYDPKGHKGAATVMLDDAPLFRARLREASLKIVDYAFYYEEGKTMDTDTPDDENEFLPHSEEDSSSLENEEEPSDNDEAHLWSAKNEGDTRTEKIIATHEIPITVTVEIARLKMNLEKLLQIKTGNLIELPVRPEQGVDLVISGKRVAKGELIKIGETLGVKILQIGE